ncbi:hypothetical protein YC2023_083777 [Brassica napus]|uniref:Uncharacterized protein n=1 Tax=Brassica oleracea TaxID=3712 RepID=A0A3P6ELN6_BRAOL|nr:unnamed protein product [Brassica oleracea]
MTGRPADLSSGAEMTRRRTGHASIVEKKTTSSRGVKMDFWAKLDMTTARIHG